MPSKMLTPHQMFGFLFKKKIIFPFLWNITILKRLKLDKNKDLWGVAYLKPLHSTLSTYHASSCFHTGSDLLVGHHIWSWQLVCNDSSLWLPRQYSNVFTTLLYINHHSAAFLLVLFVCCTTVNHFLCRHNLSVTTSSSSGMLFLNLHIYLQGN